MTKAPSSPPKTGTFEPPEDVPALTALDYSYLQLYLRLLDADAAGIDWTVAARDILGLDSSGNCAARQTFDRFLSRAKWMTSLGYRLLLKSDDR